MVPHILLNLKALGAITVVTATDLLFASEQLKAGQLDSELLKVGIVSSETLKTAVFSTETLNQ